MIIGNEVLAEAGLKDVSAIANLVNCVYRGSGGQVGWTSEVSIVDGLRVTQAEVISLITRPESAILLLHIGNRMMGCVHIEKKETKSYVGMLAIDSKLQGGGYGSRLLKCAETYAEDKFESECVEMCVVSQRRELISFYLNRGYSLVGNKTEYPVTLDVGKPKQAGLTVETLSKKLL